MIRRPVPITATGRSVTAPLRGHRTNHRETFGREQPSADRTPGEALASAAEAGATLPPAVEDTGILPYGLSGSATPWLRHAHIRCWPGSSCGMRPSMPASSWRACRPVGRPSTCCWPTRWKSYTPPGMMWSDRQPADLSKVVEIWFRPALAPPRKAELPLLGPIGALARRCTGNGN